MNFSVGKMFMNMFCNFIPNKIIVFDYKKLQRKCSNFDITFLRLGIPYATRFFENQNSMNVRKRDDPSTTPKSYWSILETLANDSKIPLILSAYLTVNFN